MQAAERLNLLVDSGAHTCIPRPVCLLPVSAFLNAALWMYDLVSLDNKELALQDYGLCLLSESSCTQAVRVNSPI